MGRTTKNDLREFIKERINPETEAEFQLNSRGVERTIYELWEMDGDSVSEVVGRGEGASEMMAFLKGFHEGHKRGGQ